MSTIRKGRYYIILNYSLTGTADPESGAENQEMLARLRELQSKLEAATKSPKLIWLFLVLLLIGNIASVVGYIGCFSVVQSTRESTVPIVWLFLEAALSILRMFLWGWNPNFDDAPPLSFSLRLTPHAPLPTCNKFSDEIEEERVLPLVRATQFLEEITSYAGLLTPFADVNISLFYTLTRTMDRKRSLYITLFDYKERTTRIYIPSHPHPFRSAEPLALDLKNGILETRIGEDACGDDDPIKSDHQLIEKLKSHYESILGQIREGQKEDEIIENDWTLNVNRPSQVTTSEDQSSSKNTDSEDKVSLADDDDDMAYLNQGRLERQKRLLGERRGQWIVDYMSCNRRNMDWDYDALVKRTKADERAPDGMKDFLNDEWEDKELLLVDEWEEMELLFIDEIKAWEYKLWDGNQQMVTAMNRKKGMSSKDAMELETRLSSDWRKNARIRLTKEKDAMNQRLETEQKLLYSRAEAASIKGTNERLLKERWEKLVTEIRKGWKSVIEMFANDSTPILLSPDSRQTRSCNNLKKMRDSSEQRQRRWSTEVRSNSRTSITETWGFSKLISTITSSGYEPTPFLPTPDTSQTTSGDQPNRTRDLNAQKQLKERTKVASNSDQDWQSPESVKQKGKKREVGSLKSQRTKQRIEAESRLKSELDDIETRLAQGLESSVKEFQTSEDIASFRYSKRWAFLDPQRQDIAAISRALARNKRVLLIIVCLDSADSKFIQIAQMVPLLTTIVVCIVGQSQEELISRALLPAVEKNRNIIAINDYYYSNSSLWSLKNSISKDLKVALRRNISRSNNQTSISFEGQMMVICTDDSLRLGDKSKIVLQFLGPTEGCLILRLTHRADKPGASLEIHMEGKDPLNHSIPQGLMGLPVIEEIYLSPGLHFAPRVRNTLSLLFSTMSLVFSGMPLVFPGNDYYLHDIELLDENNLSYDPDHLSNQMGGYGRHITSGGHDPS